MTLSEQLGCFSDDITLDPTARQIMAFRNTLDIIGFNTSLYTYEGVYLGDLARTRLSQRSPMYFANADTTILLNNFAKEGEQ